MNAPCSPGKYLRLRREAAGLTCEDIALRTETTPPISARARAEWLARVEADIDPITFGMAFALARWVKFDPDVLDRLIAARRSEGHVGAVTAICRDCGCSWRDPCVDAGRRQTCGWVNADQDWCTACAARAVDRAVDAALSPASVAA